MQPAPIRLVLLKSLLCIYLYIYIYEATVCQERSTPEIAEPEQPEAYSLEYVYTGAETEGMLQSIYILVYMMCS